MEEQILDFGLVSARWENKKIGMCNFCSSTNEPNYQKVLVVEGGGVQIRFCRSCFNRVKALSR